MTLFPYTTLFRSGRTWVSKGTIAAAGTATSLAVAPTSGTLLLATSRGIYYSSDGRTWLPAAVTGSPPPGGFSFVGMTFPQRGVAVPARSQLHEIFVTLDGGLTWQPSPIR